MARRRNRVDVEWETSDPVDMGTAQLEVLMDIRSELRRLNGLLHCSNFVGIPSTLKSISRKIPTRRKVKR